jgi:hypothetical protein
VCALQYSKSSLLILIFYLDIYLLKIDAMSVTHRVTVATKTNEEQRISSRGGGGDGKTKAMH